MADLNFRVYQNLRRNRGWLKRHVDSYVGFADGKLVVEGKDRQQVLRRLREGFPEENKFFTKVDEEEKILELSSPLCVE